MSRTVAADPRIVRGRYACTIWTVAAVAFTACGRGTAIDTLITFDGERRTITTANVTCTRQPDESLVVLVVEKTARTVRIHLSQRGHIAVLKAGFRYDELSGFVGDPEQMTGSKVDDNFTVRGRMPPADGERDWHSFTIETSCPSYRNAVPADTVPNIGSP